ncbi:hypothetical protein [Nocardioides sp. SYSU D00038]|nr:hypothetical protein [Nocardioides sp. SYSU D00038]
MKRPQMVFVVVLTLIVVGLGAFLLIGAIRGNDTDLQEEQPTPTPSSTS